MYDKVTDGSFSLVEIGTEQLRSARSLKLANDKEQHIWPSVVSVENQVYTSNYKNGDKILGGCARRSSVGPILSQP